MRIGFDAKRAFFNRSGLGNYSRDTIRSLYQHYPHHEYFIYTPGVNDFQLLDPDSGIHTVCAPSGITGKIGKAYWRSFLLSNRLKRDRIEVYHGLSNELPHGIEKSGIKTVVTIHDLIFMRHPEWYKPVDRMIYRKKFSHSSRISDAVITVSRQTRDDLITFFGIEEKKIEVIYQSCNIAFRNRLSGEEKQLIRTKWNLPAEYILYVGTVEERKNLLTLVKAMHRSAVAIPLVVIGRQTGYAAKVHKYINTHQLKNIRFLNEIPVTDLPGIYQMASIFIYPSLFEGFGIPILEALFSGVPVITSKGGCFNEVGGEHSIYIDPQNEEEIGNAILNILSHSKLHAEMSDAGLLHAQQFSGQAASQQLMDVYNRLVHG